MFVVALLAEGVDRNNEKGEKVLTLDQSPSSRRAWIEITFKVCTVLGRSESPSSRRAWIEI